MNPTLEKVYFKSPILLQNIFLSLYGYRINKIRHGGIYNKRLTEINKRLRFTPLELEAFQLVSLRKILQLCIDHVPYYSKSFKKNGINVNKIKTLNDFRKEIPLLEKANLRKFPEQFINKLFKKSNLLRIHTTGTTGTPLDIYSNMQVRQTNYAFYSRFLQISGIDYKKKRITLGGRIIMTNNQSKSPFWRYSSFQKNLLMSSYHLRENTMRSYIDKIIKFSPHYIDAYPSSLYTLAKYAQVHSINLRGVTQGITTSAETLFDAQRALIEDIFGLPIIDQYGAAEMCVFVGQCQYGHYHVHSDYGILEFLREDGNAASPGEEAELVCTGFVNTVMPLVRYRIGDIGTLSDKVCKCGLPFPVVEKILGRIDDVIITPEGSRVGRLSPVVKGLPVKEVQYRQDRISSVVVHLVPDVGYNHKIANDLETELQKRLGRTIKIEIKEVKRIDRGVGGKLKSIVSTL